MSETPCGAHFSTRSEVFDIMYGSGPVSGFFVSDDVSIGSLTLKHFTFAEVPDTASLPNYENMEFDGALCDWPPTRSRPKTVPHFSSCTIVSERDATQRSAEI